MARNERDAAFNPDDAIRALQKLPPPARRVVAALAVLAVLGASVYFLFCRDAGSPTQPGAAPGPAGTYLFCTWNVENFFDDQDDPANHDETEDWFARDPAAFRQKTDRLADALLLMNGDAGPDILAVCEVESERCLGALRDAVNAKLRAAGKGELCYEHILFIEDKTGRRFAPGILTRLAVVADRTQKLGSGGLKRTLEGHLRVNGHELVVIASHWTSHARDSGAADKDRSAANRSRYAESCYGRARAIVTANPDAEVIVCGDFNDEFVAPSLQQGLHATADALAVQQARAEPRLLDLCAGLESRLDPKGTIYYGPARKWSVFDHICVSRGLLDESGWSCDPKETEIFAPKELRTNVTGEPFKFGGLHHKGERGYSDHFPVITRLRLEGSGPPAKEE